jgi:predicted metal-dependent enzyme (double-stranded beta helix superfamily)
MTHPLVPPTTQDLMPGELAELVAAIAAQPERWRHLVHGDGAERRFEQLWRDEHIDVWVISWMEGNDTGFHDHDVSHGAVAVVTGEIVEEGLRLDGTVHATRHRAGESFAFDAAHVHRMRQDAAVPAVSIHVYSPPLERMGAYTVDADGRLRRASVASTEELRPSAVAA